MRAVLASLPLLFPVAAPAWETDGMEVDLELVLAVDVSRSMSPDELEVQRRGYAEALRSAEVVETITSGMIGRIAVTYVEWAGEYSQHSSVDWTLIESAADAEAFAARIGAHVVPGMRRTSISGALLYATDSFEDNGFHGLRRVVDISGDGPNNQGRPVDMARDRALERGISINGLPLMTPEDELAIWDIADLDVYYEDCVVGGPGAFVLPVYGWDEFPDAVKRKLVLEIAGKVPAAPERIWQAQDRAEAGADCTIGEKTWERYRGHWGEP
ncbi:DUF1194 domain-containing protein [Rhodosalinus sp.]|uniref:DUF1194 domain-containing protein n=1 Tax=Rhodosalinus sp. TaxID=2047741 RepID=UPI0039790FA7